VGRQKQKKKKVRLFIRAGSQLLQAVIYKKEKTGFMIVTQEATQVKSNKEADLAPNFRSSTGVVAQVAEYLPSKHEAQTSSSITGKQKTKLKFYR
jgi:hypothetical protein